VNVFGRVKRIGFWNNLGCVWEKLSKELWEKLGKSLNGKVAFVRLKAQGK